MYSTEHICVTVYKSFLRWAPDRFPTGLLASSADTIGAMAAKRRLDWTELLLIVPFVAVTTWLIAAHVVTERHLINDVLAMDGRRELLELAGQYGDQRSTRYA